MSATAARLHIEALAVLRGGRRVLHDVSFAVGAGEALVLRGPNGAGKTTLLRVALGFISAEAGEVRLGGDDPRALSPRERALRAAYMPQKPSAAWPMKVEAVAALGRFAHGGAPSKLNAVDQQAVDAALDACALAPLRQRRVDQISGGERMRVHLARTLAQGAPLLLLDEPTAGLDPAQSLAVGEILQARAREGGGVVFATHDISLAARFASRVVLMAQGRVIADGTPREALTREALALAYGRDGKLLELDGEWIAVFR